MLYIITVTYNPIAGGYLDQFVECLNKQDFNYKAIILDNNSHDGTIERLKSINNPNISIILNSTNVGFATACNQGISIAINGDAEHIVFLNNDTYFESNFLNRLYTAMVQSDADAMSPLITYYPDTDSIWYAGGRFRPLSGYMPYHQNHGQSIVSHVPSSRFVDFASGCCLIVRRDLIESIGGFDENYFVYWEDADFCYRMKERGFKIFFSIAVTIFHIGSASTGGSNSDFSIYQYSKNHMIFLRKHFGEFFAIFSLLYILPKIFAKLLLRRFSLKQCKTQIDGLRHGLNFPRAQLFTNTPKRWGLQTKSIELQ